MKADATVVILVSPKIKSVTVYQIVPTDQTNGDVGQQNHPLVVLVSVNQTSFNAETVHVGQKFGFVTANVTVRTDQMKKTAKRLTSRHLFARRLNTTAVELSASQKPISVMTRMTVLMVPMKKTAPDLEF